MPGSHQFEYLPLILRDRGPARFPAAPQDPDPRPGIAEMIGSGLAHPVYLGEPACRVANHHFGHWSRRAAKFLQRHCFDIIQFAENSTDSLVESIENRYGSDSKSMEARARNYAEIVYAWVCRADRPWWKHPRWHFWHWRIQFHPWQRFRRRWWDKCCVCGKRGFTGAAIGNWEGDRIWHSSCDQQLRARSHITVQAVDASEIFRRTGTP